MSICVAANVDQAKPWFCYLLECSDKSTYIGATVDVNRRLRQHNSELVGGARRTTAKSAGGVKRWARILYVSGFYSSIEALQFEWRWKFISKSSRKTSAIERRLDALPDTLCFKDYGTLIVHVEECCPADIILTVQTKTGATVEPAFPTPQKNSLKKIEHDKSAISLVPTL